MIAILGPMMFTAALMIALTTIAGTLVPALPRIGRLLAGDRLAVPYPRPAAPVRPLRRNRPAWRAERPDGWRAAA